MIWVKLGISHDLPEAMMRGVVLDLDSLHPGDLDLSRLQAALPEWSMYGSTASSEVQSRIRDAQVVLSNKVMLDRAAFAAAGALRLVVVMATGTNNIDLDAARENGVQVCNVRGYAVDSVAEHTLLLILALARGLLPYRSAVLDGNWSRSPFFCLHGPQILELSGRRLGVIGCGELGSAVARRCEALGMEVVTAALPGREHSPVPWPRLPLDEALASCPVISLHCPLTPQTRGRIGARELGLMPRGALLVNTARGGLVDEAALIDALESGHLGGAALDTLETEPPLADSALLRAAARLDSLLVTPHVAWAGRAARQRLVDQMVEVIAAFRGGQSANRVA
jgi:glycerate dehydrogenase